MKQTLRKYRTNTLTPSELSEARECLKTVSDAQFFQALSSDWNEFDPPVEQYNLEAEERVKANIKHIIKPPKINLHRSLIYSLSRIAAIFIFALLSFSTYHFYTTSKEMGSQWFRASTNKNERVEITLPDGSLVELNNESVLKYTVTDFMGDKRRICFSGEAYFEITSLPQKPFLIETPNVEVFVKGTIFNLSVREEGEEAVLSLIDGNVQLTSRKTAQTVDIKPNEKAVVNYTTGDISVIPIGYNDNVMAWRQRRLSFVNASYEEVIEQLNKYYGDQLPLPSLKETSERFTGMIPLDNTSVALDIISATFK